MKFMSRRLDTRYDNVTRPEDLRLKGGLAIIGAGSAAILSAMFFLLGEKTTPMVQQVEVCNFTTDTKTVEAQSGEGLIGLAIEVDGITEESPCLEDAKQMVVALNPSKDPLRPAAGEVFVIPQSLVNG